MIKLDVVKAAFSGFGVIGRNPLAVLVWAVFLFVVGILPVLGLVGGFVSSIVQLAALENTGAEPTPEQVMPLIGSMLALFPILMITGLITRTVLTGAVYRAVLFPEEKSWFYLRLGARELWLALVIVVAFVFAFILSFVIQIVGSMVMLPFMFMTAAADPDNAAAAGLASALISVPLMLGMFALFAFLYARFGMAFPMTFAESKFRLFESWGFTRGNGWRFVLVLLLLCAIALLLEIVLWIVLIAVGASVVGMTAAAGGFDGEGIEAFFKQDPSVWMAALAPWIALGAVVISVVGTALVVIFTAPWAHAYRQLKAGPATTEPPVAA